MPKKTTILILLLAVITAILVFFAVSANKTPPQLQTTENQTPSEEVVEKTATIYFNPQSVDLSISTTSATAVDIMIDTGENSVSGVQTELQYDPTAITNVRVDPAFGTDGFFGPSAVLLLNEIDPTTGRISFASAISTSQSQLQGSGKIATIYFENAFGAQSSSTISFLNKTYVTILGSNEDVLKQTMPLNITLSNPNIQLPPQDQPIFETLPEEPLNP